jgi:hypothetical protein
VDRRLQGAEVQQIRGLPRKLGFRTLVTVSPRHRQVYLYTRSFLAALDTALDWNRSWFLLISTSCSSRVSRVSSFLAILVCGRPLGFRCWLRTGRVSF